MLSECAVALALVVDVSGSVSLPNYELQRDGIAGAFLTEQVQELVTNKPGGIAVSMVQFGVYNEVSVEWRIVRTKDDLINLANDIHNAHLPASRYSTLIGAAAQYTLDYFNELPCKPLKKVMDISGDGADDGGDNLFGAGAPKIKDIRHQAEEQDVIINGLPIEANEPGITEYYRNNVITTNGFIVPAHEFKDFSRAIRKKLFDELS